ncbi:hypothetical protein U1Q18_009755, partial [Sarracenia purpurea var. burkii]
MIPDLTVDCQNQEENDRDLVRESQVWRREEQIGADEEGAVCRRAQDKSGFPSPKTKNILETESGGPNTVNPASPKINQIKIGQMLDPTRMSNPPTVVMHSVENTNLQIQHGEDANRTRVHGWKRKARGKREWRFRPKLALARRNGEWRTVTTRRMKSKGKGTQKNSNKAIIYQ